MTDVTDFLPKVMLSAPGVAEPVAADAIIEAAREFCERTRLWREEFDCAADTNPIDIVPYDATPNANEITLLEDSEVFEFDETWCDDVLLTQKDTAWLDDNVTLWRTTTDTGTPAYITQLKTNTMMLVPGFETATVKAFLFLRPILGAVTLPDFLYSQYRDAIAAGALAKLLVIPGQPFTNPDLAAYYQGKFGSKLDDLSSRKTRGQQRARIRLQPSYF